ncbi:MAG: Rieske 2Fe-2S domain-containing protein [Burkholderiaceae bacterium]|nr:Rieske 2Fe-2S domain-containing protein [Burkholderiaceae bacterium]
MSQAEFLKVDKDRGVFLVSRRAFVDADVLEREREKIFDTCWLYLGHDSELAQPGAYLTRSVGGRNLVFVRGTDGEVRALMNACPHRGATVVRERSGRSKFFTCAYHGWVFSVDGKNRDIPDGEAYGPGFNDDGHADLVPVPKLASYRDFWFVCFDPNAQSLTDYLAGVAEYLDVIADQSLERMQIVGGNQEYSVRANWKLLVENSFDGYHALSTHASYFDYLKSANGVLSQSNVYGIARDLGNGHACVEYTAPWGRPVANWVPALGDEGKAEIEKVYAGLEAKHGAQRAERLARYSRNILIFPNLMINDVMSLTIRTFYPRSTDFMEVMAWSLAPKEESTWMRKARLDNFLEFLGPGGFATPDDNEMLEHCQRGYQNRKEAGWNDVSRGMLKQQPATIDEYQIRTFWRQWDARVNGSAGSPGAARTPTMKVVG